MPQNKNNPGLDNIRIKYSNVLNLKTSEGEIQWNRYNAMLLANTIIIGFISTSYNSCSSIPQFFKLTFQFFPIFGLFLCNFWYQMTERGFMWTKFWMDKANELENQIKSETNPINEGKRVRDILGEGVTKRASLSIIIFFAIIYIGILSYNLITLCSNWECSWIK